MKNKIIALFLSVLLFSSISVSSFAANAATPLKGAVNTQISPMWTNTDYTQVTLGFTGSRADCSAVIYGKSGVNKITATATLYRISSSGSLTAVKTWSGLSAAGSELDFNQVYYVYVGYNYRLVINANVYNGSIMENITVYDEAFCG
ncbi:MAG: hypothetical protein K0Q85_721 [Caproiciproducens sp.]|jgi:hypothetical protein|nr:hypothetical protein [Caproiciproducens sp.]